MIVSRTRILIRRTPTIARRDPVPRPGAVPSANRSSASIACWLPAVARPSPMAISCAPSAARSEPSASSPAPSLASEIPSRSWPTPPAATSSSRPRRASCLTGPVLPFRREEGVAQLLQRLDPFDDRARADHRLHAWASSPALRWKPSSAARFLGSVIGPVLGDGDNLEGRVEACRRSYGRPVRRPAGRSCPERAVRGSAGPSSAPAPAPPAAAARRRSAAAASGRPFQRRADHRHQPRTAARRGGGADPPAVDVGPSRMQERRADDGRHERR